MIQGIGTQQNKILQVLIYHTNYRNNFLSSKYFLKILQVFYDTLNPKGNWA